MLTHIHRRFFSCTLLTGSTAATYGKALTLKTFVTFVSLRGEKYGLERGSAPMTAGLNKDYT